MKEQEGGVIHVTFCCVMGVSICLYLLVFFVAWLYNMYANSNNVHCSLSNVFIKGPVAPSILEAAQQYSNSFGLV